MRAIDADKLCVDLMERWDIADKQKEELVKQVMAYIVTPIVVSQPTVEPERKKGKWIPQDHNKITDMASTLVFYYPKCSECGHSGNYTNFCPRCGADMKGDEHD